jgi:DNA-binding response OmpR family regulator
MGGARRRRLPPQAIPLRRAHPAARSPAASPRHEPDPKRIRRTARALTGAVTRDGRTIDLSKERAVLEALLNAIPAGLSAEKLLAQAWDEHADTFTNTVRLTNARLRRKLGEPPIIQTIPGIGYRIAADQREPS